MNISEINNKKYFYLINGVKYAFGFLPVLCSLSTFVFVFKWKNPRFFPKQNANNPVFYPRLYSLSTKNTEQSLQSFSENTFLIQT